MDNLVKVGLVGCGRISDKHIFSYLEIPNSEVVAVCDIIEEKAKKLANKLNCKYVTNYKDLLKIPEINLIDICTPSGLHAEMTIQAAQAKKNVLTEKPMAMTIEDADKMIEECKKANVKLFVIKQNRYNPPIKLLKQALDKGRFGKIVLANTTVRWSRPQSYYEEDEWRKKDSGVLINQASHHIDLLQWLIGPVEKVYGLGTAATHKIESEDTAVAVLKFKNGTLGTIEATTCIYPKNIEGSISIFGENGSVKIGGVAVNKIDHWDFKDFSNDDGIIAQSASNPPDVYGFGHLHYMRDVVNAILNNKSSIVDGVDGIEGKKSLQLILAIYHSMTIGEEVKLS